MKVAVLFSGGKDSCQAVYYALQQGWQIERLIAVKPKNTEAYLWHYATVELTKLQAEAMGLPITLVHERNIGPERETEAIEKVLARLDVDAVLLGGVGLQKTQIRKVREVCRKFGIDVLIPYDTLTSERLLEEEINTGFEIVVTDVASDGLGRSWLGRRLNKESLGEIKKLSKRYGFDVLGEGGYYNSLVLDGPIFNKKLELEDTKIVWDKEIESGYIKVKKAKIKDK